MAALQSKKFRAQSVRSYYLKGTSERGLDPELSIPPGRWRSCSAVTAPRASYTDKIDNVKL